MTFDARELRNAFGAFLTGVNVVTTVDETGAPLGFTANSFTSVSLEPPLLLVCLARTSRNFDALTRARGFAVNILSEGQKDVSNIFARPVEDRFSSVRWRLGPFGSPVLEEVAAWFDCALHEVIEAGDHVILLGRVESFENTGLAGLGYARGGYFTPALAEKTLLATADGRMLLGAVAERDGAILLVPDGSGGWTIPFVEKLENEGIAVLEAHVAAVCGATLQTGLLYSVYEDTQTSRQHVVYRASLGPGSLATGALFAMTALPLDRVADGAVRELLRRFAQESAIGNFGVYVGNQEQGRVHAVAAQG